MSKRKQDEKGYLLGTNGKPSHEMKNHMHGVFEEFRITKERERERAAQRSMTLSKKFVILMIILGIGAFIFWVITSVWQASVSR